MITWRKLPQFMGRQFRYPGGDRFRTRINLQCTQFPQLLGLYASLETMKALPRLYNTYSRSSISFTAAQILRVWGPGCGCSFPVLFDFPTFGGSKIPARNRSPSCRNGFQTTACTTGVCGTGGFCAGNHVQKIIGLERKRLKTT